MTDREPVEWATFDFDDLVIGPMQISYIGEIPKRPVLSHKIEWRGEFWPPEYDPMKGDTWNGQWYPERPEWAKEATR